MRQTVQCASMFSSEVIVIDGLRITSTACCTVRVSTSIRLKFEIE